MRQEENKEGRKEGGKNGKDGKGKSGILLSLE